MGDLRWEPPQLVGEEDGWRVVETSGSAAVRSASPSGLLFRRRCGWQCGVHPVVYGQALEANADVQEVHDGLGVDGLLIGIPHDPATWHDVK